MERFVEPFKLAGRCPNCDLVTDDEINLRFTNQSECNICGAKLVGVTTGFTVLFRLEEAQDTLRGDDE